MSTPLVSARAVRGELRLRAERDATGKTVLADRHAAGAFHLSKPYWDGHALMLQWINPTAGIFAGDVLESDVCVGERASLLLTTPSATRIHTRIHPSTPPGEQRLRFKVADGGFLEVQPEWLIPQKGSHFVQDTVITLEQGAGLFFAEWLAPGRAAKGELLEFDRLDLAFKIVKHGNRVVQDRLHVRRPDTWKLRSSQGEPTYLATLVLAGPFVESLDFRALAAVSADDRNLRMGTTRLASDLAMTRLAAVSPMSVRRATQGIRAVARKLCPQLQANTRKL